MYSEYPFLIHGVLLLLMLSGGVAYLARKQPGGFIFYSLIWMVLFFGALGSIGFFTNSF